MNTVLILVNLIFGLAIFILNLIYYRQCRVNWRWMKLLYGMIGLFHVGLYALVLFTFTPGGQLWYSVAFPVDTLTLGIVLSGSILTYRRDCYECE